jgi:hypothetical protein
MMFSAYLGGANAAGLHRYDSQIRAHKQETIFVQPGRHTGAGLRTVHFNASSANPA